MEITKPVSESTQLKNLPRNNTTPMIEKISQNITQTRRTSKIAGIDCPRTLIKFFKPKF